MASPSLYLKNATVGLLMIVPLVLALLVLAALQSEAASDATALEVLRDSLARWRAGAGDAWREADSLRRELRRLDQPPLLVLSEAEGYTFASGSAEISPEFAWQLDNVIAWRVRELAAECACDVVEVIGHTDGQLVSTRSNLDRALGSTVFSGAGSLLSPGSNADLGLMRAWSVAERLRRHSATQYLRFYGFSAAQTIDTAGGYAQPGDVADRPERRRIEIRLRRLRSGTRDYP